MNWKPPRLRTLPIWEWLSQPTDHLYTAMINAADGTTYGGLVRQMEKLDGWNACLSVNGDVVHKSEHASRDEAMHGAWLALKRAIALREIE